MTDNQIREILIALARLEEQVKAMRESVDNLNGFRDWAVRLVVGAVILSLVGMLWAQGN